MEKEMKKTLEIELKSLLTKKEFEQLLEKLEKSYKKAAPYKQTNHYFFVDGQKTSLRIREKSGEYELTAKFPAESVGGINTTDEQTIPLSGEEARDYLENGLPPSHPFLQRMRQLNAIYYRGSLVTERRDYVFPFGVLSLDYNTYNEIKDYEVELETTEETVHAANFFWRELGLVETKSVSKMKRYQKSLKN